MSDRLEDNFADAVSKIQHFEPVASASSSAQATLDPSANRSPAAMIAAKDLGVKYAEADISAVATSTR